MAKHTLKILRCEDRKIFKVLYIWPFYIHEMVKQIFSVKNGLSILGRESLFICNEVSHFQHWNTTLPTGIKKTKHTVTGAELWGVINSFIPYP